MATVLNVHFAGNSHWDDPDKVVPVLDYRVQRTGESEISDSVTPEIAAKVLGIYKTAIQLNNSAADAVKAHAYTTYGLATNCYDHVFVIGGYAVL